MTEQKVIFQETGLANDSVGNVEVFLVGDVVRHTPRVVIEARRGGKRVLGLALKREGIKDLIAALVKKL